MSELIVDRTGVSMSFGVTPALVDNNGEGGSPVRLPATPLYTRSGSGLDCPGGSK